MSYPRIQGVPAPLLPTDLISSVCRLSVESRQDLVFARGLAEELELAADQVRRILGFVHDVPCQVILHAGTREPGSSFLPRWASGLYDGRIHIWSDEVPHERARRLAVFRHEYSHVVVSAVTHHAAPTWLQEGVALFAERAADTGAGLGRRAAVHEEVGLVWGLPSDWFALSEQDARWAYRVSDHAVSTFIRHWGVGGLRDLLDRLGVTGEISRACRMVTNDERCGLG
jgi:hypothetical protein